MSAPADRPVDSVEVGATPEAIWTILDDPTALGRILPQVGLYQTTNKDLVFSYVSVDRTSGPALVTGEYRKGASATDAVTNSKGGERRPFQLAPTCGPLCSGIVRSSSPGTCSARPMRTPTCMRRSSSSPGTAPRSG